MDLDKGQWQGLMNNNKYSGSIKDESFAVQLTDYQLAMEDLLRRFILSKVLWNNLF